MVIGGNTLNLGGEEFSAVPSLRQDQTPFTLQAISAGGSVTESYTVPPGKKLYITTVTISAVANTQTFSILKDAGEIARWHFGQAVVWSTQVINMSAPVVILSGDTFDLRLSNTGSTTAIGWEEDA